MASTACKAKPSPSAQSETKAEAKTAKTASEPAAEAVLSDAEELEITKDFITRFLDAIDANDATRWPAIITKERADRFAREGVIDKVYAAWHLGTATVADKLRVAPFHLEKTPEKITLHFEGVIVATDPDSQYSMAVRIIDGKMFLDEN